VHLNRWTWLPSAIAFTALVGAIVFSASHASARERGQDAAATAPASDDESVRLFNRMCSECHDSKRIVARRRTSSEWETTLKDMITEGAEGTEKEFVAVFNYLVRTYGKVFINTAPATEIRAVLGVTPAQADAIVAYRKENGPFADAEAVKKVPGLDLKKIDELAEALAF